MQYRPEIDGLRSVAVLPVILFHAGFTLFSGGYVGVDVFFVISGYLITTILIGERESGTYSIWGFYERRARRILPAFFVMLLFTIPIAWQLIPPDPFEDYARSLAFASLFSSNIHFLEKSAYFDLGAEFRPLLHTWSLGIEEQYYLLFPLVLWGLGMFVRRKFLIVFLILSVLSLAVAEWGWRNYPTENFFFLPSRLWELLAGSICAALLFGRAQMRSEVGAMAGLALILFSVFFYDEHVPFPSVYTLVPILGTVFIILFAAKDTKVARLLSMPPLVGIGLISYSAYLWHQPLFVFTRITSVGAPSLWLMSLMAVLSLVLAYVTWRFVETPFRRRRVLASRRNLLSCSAVGIVAFAAFGIWGDLSKGIPSRHDNGGSPMMAEWRDQRVADRDEERCVDRTQAELGNLCIVYASDKSKATIALVGDSHGRSILPAFEAVAKDHDVTVFKGLKAGCPPVLGVYLSEGGTEAVVCNTLVQFIANQVVLSEIETVFIAARWSLYASGTYGELEWKYALSEVAGSRVKTKEKRLENFEAALRRTIKFYRDHGVEVVLIEQVPQHWAVPENLLLQAAIQGLTLENARLKFRTSFVDRPLFDDLISDAKAILKRVALEEGAKLLSLTDFFVLGERYAWFLDDTVLYRDPDHLSTIGALKLGPLISEFYGKIK